MMTDYKSKELNLFSGDARNKLRIVSETNAVLESEVFKFKHGLASVDGKGEVTGNMPVYIPRLCADVGGSAVYISDWLWQDRQTIASEQQRAISAESALRSDSKTKYELNLTSINMEVARASQADSKHSQDIASETLARQQGDSQLTTSLSLEQSAREAGDSALSSLVSLNKAIMDGYVSVNDQTVMEVNLRITEYHNNYNQRFNQGTSDLRDVRIALSERLDTAEENISATQNLVMDEAGRAQTVEANLQTQISNLLANTDAVALNSLAELVADYRVNGSGVSSSVSALTDRVAYLEGVIAMLVAKSV
jgi:hypothetical protein